MKKTCVYCGKEFEVNPVGCGGNTRLFCYDCFPEGMTREDITALKRLLLIDLVSKLKIERGCDICGYNESAWALEWHHVNPETKSGQLSVMLTDMKWETYLNEIEKCVLLCANCHREVHELERAQRNKYLCYVDKQVKKRKSKQKKNNNKQANMKHNVYRPSQLIPPLLTDDDIYALYNLKNHSIKQVAKIIGCDPMTIASVINKFPDIKQYKQASGKIIMIDRQTNLPLNMFDSVADAAVFLQKTAHQCNKIRDVCNGKRKSAYGYFWKWDKAISTQSSEDKQCKSRYVGPPWIDFSYVKEARKSFIDDPSTRDKITVQMQNDFPQMSDDEVDAILDWDGVVSVLAKYSEIPSQYR